jgi:hypothetical protein
MNTLNNNLTNNLSAAFKEQIWYLIIYHFLFYYIVVRFQFILNDKVFIMILKNNL